MIIIVDFDSRGVFMLRVFTLLITICCRMQGNSRINVIVLISHLLNLCRLLCHMKIVSEVQE